MKIAIQKHWTNGKSIVMPGKIYDTNQSSDITEKLAKELIKLGVAEEVAEDKPEVKKEEQPK